MYLYYKFKILLFGDGLIKESRKFSILCNDYIISNPSFSKFTILKKTTTVHFFVGYPALDMKQEMVEQNSFRVM